MANNLRVPLKLLGQSGCCLSFKEETIYIDPYLSNSVEILEGSCYERQIPIALEPESISNANWVLVTHDHLDHCDPLTLPKIATASPEAKFLGPAPVLKKLKEWGVSEDRLLLASEKWMAIDKDLYIRSIPAAHQEIERDDLGNLKCVGFLLKHKNHKIYVSGDTSARQEIIDILLKEAPINTAILPVNEHNYFRGRDGIIGNMSVREAFLFAEEIKVKQVIPVHWDMFAPNSVEPEEIRLIYRSMKPSFSLLLKPEVLNLSDEKISVIIRTLNEAVHLGALLQSISEQKTDNLSIEVVLIDSGSTDGTVEIAEQYDCKIHHITREEFSFGRSLNLGCEVAQGDILVITSGHCVPCDETWIQNLCEPILDGKADYTYGRQFGGPESQFSECQIFSKYFPETSQIPQQGYFCNNANSAISHKAWEQYRFDEELTGLEDMELAKRLVTDGGKVAYVAEAGVYHYHDETWAQIKRRFEREAIALQQIMPHIHMQYHDVLRYVTTSILKDWRSAWKQKHWLKNFLKITRYRYSQYLGSFKGNHDHRKLSHKEKEKYFFPE